MIHEIIPESRVPRFGVSPADYLDLDQYQSVVHRHRRLSHALDGAVRAAAARKASPSRRRPPRCSRCWASAPRRADLPARGGSVGAVGRGDQRVAAAAALRGIVAGGRADHARSPAVHDRRRDAGGLRVPEARPAVQRHARRRVLPLVFNPFERQARGMFYNHSVIGRLQRRRHDRTGHARHRGAGGARHGELSGRSSETPV